MAEKEASKEHAKTAIEYYTKYVAVDLFVGLFTHFFFFKKKKRNYDICKNESKESGMADALNHKAVVLGMLI